MKIEHLLTEHKKGVKAVKYAKKPQPIVGPEALKKKAKAKSAPAKTELEKHKKLATKLEDTGFQDVTGQSGFVKSTNTYSMKGWKPYPGSAEEAYNRFFDYDIMPQNVDAKKWFEEHGIMFLQGGGSLLKKLDPTRGNMLAKMPPAGVTTHYDNIKVYVKTDPNAPDSTLPDQSGGSSEPDDTEPNQKKSNQAVNSNTFDSDVQKLQQAILKRDPKALPRYGADGKLGKETRTAMAKYPDIAKQYPGIKEGKEKLSAQEKFKRGVKRAGYDMDAGAKRIEDLLAKQKKEREDREKQEKDMKEAKQPEAPKPRNFVAKNAKTAGAGVHKDAKKASKEVRGQKHKNKEMAEDSLAETYDQARAARIRYALMLRENDWDQQSDEMTPPEYEMDPAELKAIRNAEFTDEDKIQAMIKLAAGGTSDEDIAKIYDMDKETVAGILDDYIEELEAETDQDADVKEAEMGKIVDYKPGQTATLNTGPGMTTIVDLKKNPTSLTKDPATGKLKLMGPQATGTQSTTATAQPTIKAGDAVEIGKVESLQDIRRLSGLK